MVSGKITQYNNGFQYVDGILQFMPTAEGYYDFTQQRYVYNLKDHLGNNRVSFYHNPTTQQLEILNESHYYPFGMEQENPRFAKNNGEYKYKYNAKEYQDELGLYWYDYGARNYDASLGRWMNVDPLADHPNQVDKSPNAYAWNNPVNLTDPDGRCPFCPWLDAVVDIGFVAYDVAKLAYDKITTGETKSEDWLALGADADSIFVPMSVGAGMVVRAGAMLNKITSGALKTFSVGKKLDNVGAFASKNLLDKHFVDHAAEFGGKFRNADEYLKGAQNFFKRESDEIVQYTRNGEDVVRYDTKNNIFGVAGKDGTIRTMFKPDNGFDYFKNEIKQDLGEQTLKEFNKILD